MYATPYVAILNSSTLTQPCTELPEINQHVINSGALHFPNGFIQGVDCLMPLVLIFKCI